LASHLMGRIQIKGVREQGAEERVEVSGGLKEFYSEEVRNLYFSPDIISVVKARSLRWVIHTAHTEEMRIT